MKGDNRIMKTSIALMALSIPVAAYSATTLPGGRSVRVRVSRRRDGTLKVEVDAPDGIKVVAAGQGSISAEGR